MYCFTISILLFTISFVLASCDTRYDLNPTTPFECPEGNSFYGYCFQDQFMEGSWEIRYKEMYICTNCKEGEYSEQCCEKILHPYIDYGACLISTKGYLTFTPLSNSDGILFMEKYATNSCVDTVLKHPMQGAAWYEKMEVYDNNVFHINPFEYGARDYYITVQQGGDTNALLKFSFEIGGRPFWYLKVDLFGMPTDCPLEDHPYLDDIYGYCYSGNNCGSDLYGTCMTKDTCSFVLEQLGFESGSWRSGKDMGCRPVKIPERPLYK